MPFYDRIVRQCETLPGAFADGLCRKERLEYSRLCLHRNARSSIGNRQLDSVLIAARPDGDLALSFGPVTDRLLNGVSGVDQQIEDDLIELRSVTRDGRQARFQ